MDAIPHFHDGHVTGVRLREGAATIYLQQSDGSDFDLELEGLEALHLSDFREGNIISMVEVVSGGSPYVHTNFGNLFPSPHPSAAATFHEKHAVFVRQQIERIESADVSLVVITPSYGAEMLAICRNATWRRV